MEIFVAPSMDAVFRPQRNSGPQVLDRQIRIAQQRLRRRERVTYVILVGFQLVSLVQLLDRKLEVASVQARNSQGIKSVGGFGNWHLTGHPLLAKSKVDTGPFGHVTSFTVDQLFEDLRSLVVIVFVEGPDCGLERLDGGLVLGVHTLLFHVIREGGLTFCLDLSGGGRLYRPARARPAI